MKYAVNVIGYIQDDEYNADELHQMLNRLSVKECFPPLNVVEIVVKKMEDKHRIDKEKVTKRKLHHF